MATRAVTHAVAQQSAVPKWYQPYASAGGQLLDTVQVVGPLYSELGLHTIANSFLQVQC